MLCDEPELLASGPRAWVHELGSTRAKSPISDLGFKVLARAPSLGSTSLGPQARVHKSQVTDFGFSLVGTLCADGHPCFLTTPFGTDAAFSLVGTLCADGSHVFF